MSTARPVAGRLAPADPSTDVRRLAAELLDGLRAVERALRRPGKRAASGGTRHRAASTAEWIVLRSLAEAPEPLTLGALARRVHRDPSSVSVVVSRLATRSLVAKRPVPGDQRRIWLSLTPAGRRLVGRAPDGAHAALQQVLAGWPGEQRRLCVDAIAGLAAGLTEKQEPVRARGG